MSTYVGNATDDRAFEVGTIKFVNSLLEILASLILDESITVNLNAQQTANKS